MYPSKPNNTKQKAVATVLTLLAVLIITGSVSAYDHKNNAKMVATTSATTMTTPKDMGSQATAPVTSAGTSTGTSNASSGSYKDGTYTASSTYIVPPGEESIKVTLTVSNGVVTNSQIVNSENDRESVFYQEQFAGQYKSYVVGKKLADIQLSYIAGASDTAQGFDDALSQIRNQAQA